MGSCRICKEHVGFFGRAHSHCVKAEKAELAAALSPPVVKTHWDYPAIEERSDCLFIRLRGSQYPNNLGMPRWMYYEAFPAGYPLRLRREPENVADDGAVAVWADLSDGNAIHLGYLPADFAGTIHRELASRNPPVAWVLKVVKSDHTGRDLMIIQLDMQPEPRTNAASDLVQSAL